MPTHTPPTWRSRKLRDVSWGSCRRIASICILVQFTTAAKNSFCRKGNGNGFQLELFHGKPAASARAGIGFFHELGVELGEVAAPLRHTELEHHAPPFATRVFEGQRTDDLPLCLAPHHPAKAGLEADF